MAVRGELDAVGKAGLQVALECNAGVLAAVANVPGNDQLGVGIDAGLGPHVASGVGSGPGELDVLLLGVAERPNFIALNLGRGDVTDPCVTQTVPASIRSLVTVLIDTPATRLIDRMDDPSQRRLRIWTRVSSTRNQS